MIFNSDHPSRCAENSGGARGEGVYRGSPPRTRGKPCVLRHTHLFNGITPAGAGKTKPLSANAVTGYGSPPQVRGKLGKTAEIRHKRQDHPRRCGENHRRALRGTENVGSPPQVRGKRRHCLPYLVKYRITPAGAGKTLTTSRSYSMLWDHPRRCGENAGETDEDHAAAGSPPQVRGKPSSSASFSPSSRITPAGAGKTIKRYFAIRNDRDHPRRCGENLLRFHRHR